VTDFDSHTVTVTTGACELADVIEADPYCRVCGAGCGIFQGHGPGWHHYPGRRDGGRSGRTVRRGPRTRGRLVSGRVAG